MELTEFTEKIMYMKLGKGQHSILHADTFEFEFFLQIKTDAWNNKKATRSLIFHDTWSFVHWPPVKAKITINIWTWDWQKKLFWRRQVKRVFELFYTGRWVVSFLFFFFWYFSCTIRSFIFFILAYL